MEWFSIKVYVLSCHLHVFHSNFRLFLSNSIIFLRIFLCFSRDSSFKRIKIFSDFFFLFQKKSKKILFFDLYLVWVGLIKIQPKKVPTKPIAFHSQSLKSLCFSWKLLLDFFHCILLSYKCNANNNISRQSECAFEQISGICIPAQICAICIEQCDILYENANCYNNSILYVYSFVRWNVVELNRFLESCGRNGW